MAKLDRTRGFGQVYGSGSKHAYEQDGKYFDHKGDEIPSAQKVVDAKVEKYKKKAEQDQVAAQLQE